VATATIVSDASSTPTTHLLARKQLGALTTILLVKVSLRAGITTHALLVGPNSDALTVVKHPVAAPGVTSGPAVDLVPLAHLTPLLHVHQTPPLGFIATAVIDTEGGTMTIGVDYHHRHQIPLVEIFPT